MKLLQEFKQFVLRGNVIDLAVAIVIGVAFTELITSFVENVINPIIAAFGGAPNLDEWTITVSGSEIMYGIFLTQLISFILIAAVLFFFVVKPVNALISRARRQQPSDPTTKKCSFCTLDIPIDASRCPNCTSELKRAA
jgi:large conductance mechanosensitive channel